MLNYFPSYLVSDMTDNASRKIDRASKHVRELNDLFKEKRPFYYVLETDVSSGQRSVGAKRNGAVIAEAVDIIADIIQNLRTALDHAYWPIVSPFAKNSREEKAIQFPFSETAERLDESAKKRLADRVSPSFFQSIIDLKPHGGSDGNQLLYLVHDLNCREKHRLPIPTADYKTLRSDDLRRQIPDWPSAVDNNSISGFRRDVVWRSHDVSRLPKGKIMPPSLVKFEQELDVPVDIVFSVGPEGKLRPVVPVLNQMIDNTKKAIELIREAV